MKKYKIIFMVVLVAFLTGCSAEYNIVIKENTVNENIILISENEEDREILNNTEWLISYNHDIFLENASSDGEVIDENVYDTISKNGNVNFTHNFKNEEYKNSTAINECYDSVYFDTISGKKVISTSNVAKCLDNYPKLNSIKVKITVEGEVISNNADNTNGNTYEWNINKENYKNKPIKLTYTTANNQTSSTESINSTSNSSQDNLIKRILSPGSFDISFIIFALIFLIFGIVLIYFYNKTNKKDE